MVDEFTTFENLQTIVVKVEAVLNNHPVSDISDAESITLSHLLYDRPIVSLPHRDVQDDEIHDLTYGETGDIEKRARFKHCYSTIWWKKEYLTALCESHCATSTDTPQTVTLFLLH